MRRLYDEAWLAPSSVDQMTRPVRVPPELLVLTFQFDRLHRRSFRSLESWPVRLNRLPGSFFSPFSSFLQSKREFAWSNRDGPSEGRQHSQAEEQRSPTTARRSHGKRTSDHRNATS